MKSPPGAHYLCGQQRVKSNAHMGGACSAQRLAHVYELHIWFPTCAQVNGCSVQNRCIFRQLVHSVAASRSARACFASKTGVPRLCLPVGLPTQYAHSRPNRRL